jgi:hypothetical protein
MTGRPVDGGRDREIAAAYASGLTIAECTGKFGAGRGGIRGALHRTGTAFRGPGRRRKLGEAAIAVAAEQYRAGYGTPAVGAGLGVSCATARRAVLLAGTELRSREEAIRLRDGRRRREAGEYPWAAEAAARHEAGVPVGRLAGEYRVAWRTMRRAIERQGVTLRAAPRGRPPVYWAPSGGGS